MSSDGFFEGDDLDDAAFDELDAIEAAALKLPSRPPSAPTTEDDSFGCLTLDLDENDLRKLDDFESDAYNGKTQSIAGPSLSRTGSATHQTTLFGDILPSSSTAPGRPRIQRVRSVPRDPFAKRMQKTKVWDQTAFAKTGLKSGKSKGKGKASYEVDEQEEEVEFEQFPAPFIPGEMLNRVSLNNNLIIVLRLAYHDGELPPFSPPPPMKLKPDLLEAKHWIYPMNRPKRDYQFNIVKHCLFDNTIVALPTGLGKTFIAGVVMLNYYRWFPEGKVVFVAPTKPLVAQQIEACHQTCGIAGCDAAELTGQIVKSARGRLWKEKRVFYMTPQTLVNDLTTENCDARNIVLLVIDEAHRATGDYAYNQIVRFLMAKNPHFRIMALTATPGGNPDAVQRLIDGLHISHIEIRDESSLDIKPFIHHKRIEQHIITMTEDVNKVKELLAALMDRDLKPLRQKGILWGSPDPVKFHPYSAQARMGQLTREQHWAYPSLSRLGSLARAMGYLVEGTPGMCYTYMQELSRAGDEETTTGRGKSGTASKKKNLREDPMFQAVLRELDNQKARGFSVHPKMDRLRSIIVDHFAQRLPVEDDAPNDETKVMVFVTFREAVDEIVDILNFQRPLIRAHKFIGQGTDKLGKKGLAQKEQLGVVQKFKAGEFNVLVATSIGEEGLDIGEVDLIVCYDAQKTPIRMLQRLGRTGRKRAGVVHVLLAEGREELNLEKAKDTYKEVQKTILRGEQLEFYTDVPRLLPDHVKPECLERTMEIQEYTRDEGGRKSTKENRSPTSGAKRKRNDNISRNIPAGASTGFVSVADLLIKRPKKQKKTKTTVQQKDFDDAGEDDDTDLEIESGIVDVLSRRTRSFTPLSSNHPGKAALRRAKTTVPKAAKGIKQKKRTELSSSQVSNRGVDDADDVDIEHTLIPYVSPSSGKGKHGKSISPSSLASSTKAVVDLTDSEDDQVPVHGRIETETADESMAWLIDGDEDENPNFEVVDSSPIASRIFKAKASPTECCSRDIDVPYESIEQLACEDENGPIDSLDMSAAASSNPREYQTSSPLRPTSSTLYEPIVRRNGGESSAKMLPPCLPQGPSLDSPDDLQIPQPSFPVRPLAQTRRRRLIDSPGITISSPRPQRLHRHKSPKLDRNKSRKIHINVNVHTNPVFDFEAEHSGDETSEGSSGPEDKETEEDRRFLEELPETQVSPSYDQTLAYRQSLFTQAPIGAKAPTFINAPSRRGVFGVGLHARRRPIIPSSPPTEREEPDEYMLDSFVVDDDAEISYLSDD